MSAPKLSALIQAIEPDGTLRVLVRKTGEIVPIESLRGAARRMDRAFGLCLHVAGREARSVEELDDMVEMSMRAVQWLQACCLALREAGLR